MLRARQAEHGFANAFCQAERVADDGSFQLGAGHHRHDQCCRATHLYGQAAREIFRLLGRADAGEDGDIAVGIGEDEGRGGYTVDHEGIHLQLGEGATHAVAIDHGQTKLEGSDHGSQGVAAADLADDDGVDFLAQVVFQGADGGFNLVARLQLFIADGGRAHAADSANQSVIGHIIGLDDGDCPTLPPQFVFQPQAVEISAAAATSAEDAGADGDCLRIVECDGLHHVISATPLQSSDLR